MKVAIVLFNLGGPDSPRAIRPFLRNLFNDPAIIGAPFLVRWFLSHWIAFKRAPVAREIYAHIGGKSPLLELTERQAEALEQRFQGPDEVKTFVAMRYWHPMTDAVIDKVKAFEPDKIVLLPLYPQFSTTTSGSSLDDWRRRAGRAGLKAPATAVCCYPEEPGLISALAALIAETLTEASRAGKPRVLFSAHGLPKQIVEGGDPYPAHVEATARAVVDKLDIPDLDWVVCYQSRVGPLEWIGPATEDEIARAGNEGVALVVVPIAFVSEHSETLVELDMEYAELARDSGVPDYRRVAAVGCHGDFIDGLKNLTERALERIKTGDRGEADAISSAAGERICSAAAGRCIFNQGE